jgi:hypothetical protein
MKKIIFVPTLVSLLFILTACQSTISFGSDPGTQPATAQLTLTPDAKLIIETAKPVPIQPTVTLSAVPEAYIIFNSSIAVSSDPTVRSLLVISKAGDKAQAIGQTPAGDWIKIIYPIGLNETGWVPARSVTLYSSTPLPIAPEAQRLTVAPTVLADPQELAAIQKFNPNETIGKYRLEKSTIDSNLPNLKVDVFQINNALYVLDPGTNRVVEYEANQTTASSESSKKYTSDQLKQIAIQLVDAQVPGINLDKYSFELGQKIDNYFFMWFVGQPDQPGSLRVMYVGYQSDGTLLGYINALP